MSRQIGLVLERRLSNRILSAVNLCPCPLSHTRNANGCLKFTLCGSRQKVLSFTMHTSLSGRNTKSEFGRIQCTGDFAHIKHRSPEPERYLCKSWHKRLAIPAFNRWHKGAMGSIVSSTVKRRQRLLKQHGPRTIHMTLYDRKSLNRPLSTTTSKSSTQTHGIKNQAEFQAVFYIPLKREPIIDQNKFP